MSVRITYSWSCQGLPFTTCNATGTGPGSDLAARKHEAATNPSHSTIVRGVAA